MNYRNRWKPDFLNSGDKMKQVVKKLEKPRDNLLPAIIMVGFVLFFIFAAFTLNSMANHSLERQTIFLDGSKKINLGLSTTHRNGIIKVVINNRIFWEGLVINKGRERILPLNDVLSGQEKGTIEIISKDPLYSITTRLLQDKWSLYRKCGSTNSFPYEISLPK